MIAVANEREQLARLLLIADAPPDDGDVTPWADACFAATVHDGDCTKQAHTCMVCYANDYRRQADAMIALLDKEHTE